MISFSGDAVVGVWWSEEATHSDLKIKAAARVSLAREFAHCALAIQRSLSNRRYQIGTDDELVLNLRVAASASHLCGVHVGGIRNRWLFTVSLYILTENSNYLLILSKAYGLAISDIADAMAQCTVGEVVISYALWKLVQVGCAYNCGPV